MVIATRVCFNINNVLIDNAFKKTHNKLIVLDDICLDDFIYHLNEFKISFKTLEHK